jgi:dihydrofolate reductase
LKTQQKIANMITMIAAASKQCAWKNNELVWHLPNDFKRFKILHQDITSLWEGKHLKASQNLPNRTHIVISRQENYKPQGCFVVNSMEKAIEMCPRDEVSFIIGGGNL